MSLGKEESNRKWIQNVSRNYHHISKKKSKKVKKVENAEGRKKL